LFGWSDVCCFTDGKTSNCFDGDLKPEENDEEGLVVQLSRIPVLLLIKTLS